MDAFSMGLVGAVGALATICGASEDIDSDIGSQSNPNSQVQLAAQVGNPHRIYNKAIAGEPPSNALWCTCAAVVAYVLITTYHMPALMSIAAGATFAALVDGVMSTSAYLGRSASQSRFNQWIYLDIVRYTTTSIMAHVWITSFYSHYDRIHPDLHADASSSVPTACHCSHLGNNSRCHRIVCG